MSADAQLALEMDVCAEYKIPHSAFLAWPVLDRDKAIWHLVRRGGTCRGCGTHPDDWDPAKGGHRAAYLAEITLCPGCEQRQRVEKQLDSPENKGQRGLSVRMRINPEVRRGARPQRSRRNR